MRVRENHWLLWYGIVFFLLMAIVCIVCLFQNQPTKDSAGTKSATTTIDKIL